MNGTDVASLNASQLKNYIDGWEAYIKWPKRFLERRAKKDPSMSVADYLLKTEGERLEAMADGARARSFDLVNASSVPGCTDSLEQQARECGWDIDELKRRDPSQQTLGQVTQAMHEEIKLIEASIARARERHQGLTSQEMVTR